MKRTQLRDQLPGTAWAEAERRAVAVAIVGFFIAGGAASLSKPANLETGIAFSWAVSGGAIAFSITLAVLIGYYHRSWRAAMASSLCGTLVVLATRLLWFRTLAHRASFIYSVVPALASSLLVYFYLHWLHKRLSRVDIHQYLQQLTSDDLDQVDNIHAKAILWILAAIGSLILVRIVFWNSR